MVRPGAKEPIYRDKLQYDCSFTWNMGDGESCNQGVHEVDVARWILGYTGLPRRTMSIGGRFVFDDAGEVPNTQIIYYDYPQAPILYEVHNLPKNKECMTPETVEHPAQLQGRERRRVRPVRRGLHAGHHGFRQSGARRSRASAPARTILRTSSRPYGAASARTSTPRSRGARFRLRSATSGTSPIAWDVRPRVEEQEKQVGDIGPWREMHERYVNYLGDIGVDPGSFDAWPLARMRRPA